VAGAGVDWEAVRRAYELGAESVASIQKRFGISKNELTKRRIKEGWTTRPPAAQPGPLQGHKPVGEEALEFRLNRLVTIGTAMLERKMADEGINEANARMLTELCRAQESRMRTVRTKNGKIREKKNHDAGRDFRDDPDWLIAEINRRLDRIAQGHEQGGTSGASGADAAGTRAASS
jgi:hypothetical protein